METLRNLLGAEVDLSWVDQTSVDSVDLKKDKDNRYDIKCKRCGKVRKTYLWSIKSYGFFCGYCQRAMTPYESESIRGLYPVMADYYDKGNNPIPSSMLMPGTSMMARFVCDKGHDYSAVVSSVSRSFERGSIGCPYCANKAVYTGYNDFETKYPEYVKYWDTEANGVKPSEVLFGSNKMYWFTCEKGHSFLERLFDFKLHGLFCPVCHNRAVLKGYNDFESKCPNIAKYWAYDLNPRKPDEVIWGSASSFWFRCELGHTYKKPLHIIMESDGKSNGCPYCNGRAVMEGFNDFASQEPELTEMWDYDMNDVTPEEVFVRSNSYFWFRCKNGHSFKKMPVDLINAKDKRSKGCPFCARSRLTPSEDYYLSENELVNKYAEWVSSHIVGEISAEDFLSRYYDRKGEFICDKGHKFVRSWSDIKRYGVGCPVCSGHTLLKGFNDFETCNPDLVKYWDYDLNDISPDEITRCSSRVVWWKCTNCNKEVFQQAVNTRIATRGLCPKCSESYSRSFAEEELFNFISKFVEAKHNVRVDGHEIDILVPSLNIAFEYNGLYYHSEVKGKDKTYHKEKYDACKKAGITLYCVWEDDYTFKRDRVLSWVQSKLGVDKSEKVNARQCVLSYESEQEAETFLDKNHIQGHIKLSRYISLRKPSSEDGSLDTIVALMAYAETDDGFIQIRRYATSANVRGGFTKILSHLESTGVWKGAVTFSDNAVSDGGLYKNSGFINVLELEPDYSYLYKEKRVHKFNFRKERFKKNPGLMYQEGLTEEELASLNGLVRIWDYGKVKWVKYFNQNEK